MVERVENLIEQGSWKEEAQLKKKKKSHRGALYNMSAVLRIGKTPHTHTHLTHRTHAHTLEQSGRQGPHPRITAG